MTVEKGRAERVRRADHRKISEDRAPDAPVAVKPRAIDVDGARKRRCRGQIIGREQPYLRRLYACRLGIADRVGQRPDMPDQRLLKTGKRLE